MNREQLVEKARAVFDRRHSADYYPLSGSFEVTASQVGDTLSAVLDAILPQITTVAELEALPELTKVIGKDGTAWEYSGYSSPHQWFGSNGDEWSNSDLLANFGPLTVVWQPS